MSETINPGTTGERELVVTTKGLTKSFPSGFMLGPIDLSITRGETIGLVGKNGAGKTTTFQLLTGNIDANGGEVRILGHKLTPDSADLKRGVGYLPQDPTLPPWATGHEVLSYAAKLHGLEQGDKIVAQQKNSGTALVTVISPWQPYLRHAKTCRLGTRHPCEPLSVNPG